MAPAVCRETRSGAHPAPIKSYGQAFYKKLAGRGQRPSPQRAKSPNFTQGREGSFEMIPADKIITARMTEPFDSQIFTASPARDGAAVSRKSYQTGKTLTYTLSVNKPVNISDCIGVTSFQIVKMSEVIKTPHWKHVLCSRIDRMRFRYRCCTSASEARPF